MDGKKPNIIKDVLVNINENKLQLCDIHFGSKIKEIKPKCEKLFDWNDIKEKEKRNLILGEYSKSDDDTKFLLAIPGAIDSHVHFNTPGYEFREDFEHGSLSAAFGGTTTVIDMPCTSIPPVTNLVNFIKKQNALKGRSYVDYLFWGGIAGNNFNQNDIKKNVEELSLAGAAGFKVYMTSGMDTFKDLQLEQLEFIAGVISATGKTMAVHAEDKDLIAFKEKRFKSMNRNDYHAYCESRDIQAEASAVDKLISIAEKTNCKVHIVHLSSSLALKSIKHAQHRGVKITAETCPHYLYFTQKDFENKEIRNYLKTAPPVKFEEDKEALWKGLADGSIEFVTTDHAGCNPQEEKSSENFWEVYGGIPGVEHRVPFLFSEGFLKAKITLEQTIKLLSTNPAQYFGIADKGRIQKGFDADIVLLNLWKSNRIDSLKMHSKGKYTPFNNVQFNALVEKTFLKGKLISNTDSIYSGEFIKSV